MAIRQFIQRITGLDEINILLNKVAELACENAGDGIQYASDRLKYIDLNPNEPIFLADGTPIPKDQAIEMLTTERAKRLHMVQELKIG